MKGLISKLRYSVISICPLDPRNLIMTFLLEDLLDLEVELCLRPYNILHKKHSYHLYTCIYSW